MDSSHNLIDFFAVCGLNVEKGLETDQFSGDNLDCSPLDRPYKSHVLTHLTHSHPSHPFDPQAVSMLCFPQGLSFRTDVDHTSSRTHTFVITREDGSRSYGSVMTFYEEVTSPEICQAMQMLQDMHQAELSNTQSLTLKRHRERRRIDHARSRSSTLSRDPYTLSTLSDKTFRQRATQPEYKKLRDHLYCSKSICFVSRIPLVHTHLKLLSSLYDVVWHGVVDEGGESSRSLSHTRLSVESYLYNYLHEVPAIPPGSSIKIFTSKAPLSCQRPGLTDLPLFDYPLRELFSTFKVREILPIFTSVLLEHQLLIFSKDYHKLMLVAESISCLLFPFQWQHTYVPILPSSLVHFLDAPVPFIMGLAIRQTGSTTKGGGGCDGGGGEGCEEEEANDLFESFSKSNSCVVDVDRRRVGAPEDLPSFPFTPLITTDLELQIDRFKRLERNLSQHRDSAQSRGNGEKGDDDDDGGGGGKGVSGGRGGYGGSNSAMEWSVNAKLEMLQKNEALSRLTALAERSGVRSDLNDLKESLTTAALYKHKVETGTSNKPSKQTDQHTRDLIFNSSIRHVFLHYFLHLFRSYESFVIGQSGVSCRETTQNFDKTAFLSDQSDETLPFLAPFIETQMFACFIDQKILASNTTLPVSFSHQTHTQSSTPPDHTNSTLTASDSSALAVTSSRDMHNWLVFSKRLANEDLNLEPQTHQTFKRSPAVKLAESMIGSKYNMVDQTSPLPYHIKLRFPLLPRKHTFPTLPQDAFQHILKLKRREQSRTPERHQSAFRSHKRGSFKQRDEYLEKTEVLTDTPRSDTSLKVMVSNNWKLMETLLKEVKTKTKRMLVQKMGKEAVELGHADITRVGIEENTLIASLCDLLERIWSYGLIQKQDKSSLWQHLNAFHEVNKHQSEKENGGSNNNTNSSSTTDTVALQEVVNNNNNNNNNNNINLTWPIRHHRRSNSKGLELPFLDPLPTSVIFDFKNVMEMTEIKTTIGLARAFVRLSLEKKLLSVHLKQLFSNQELLRKLYKRYAFLRCEDEREQFLFHLLSLNAVDYHCFTNTFHTACITYRVLIYPGSKIGGSSTSANSWIRLSGQLGTTDEISLPKHTLDITTKHKNLGVLTSLRIGHDNTGLSAKWMVEKVLVRNQVTAHTYNFSCGRWLGKGVDDGALERLLVAELLPHSLDCHTGDTLERTTPRCRSPSLSGRHYEPKTCANEIREKLGDSVNNLVKHFCRTHTQRESSTKLLCGEGGLVGSLELILQHGFKSSRFFRNNFFIWDFLEKVVSCYECILAKKEMQIPQDNRTTMQSFCYVINQINLKSFGIGKDERFQILVCFGLRDRLLSRWVRLVSKSPVTISMYEEDSFLRDSRKLQSVIDLLDSLKEFKVVLENSVIRGIDL